MRIDLPTDRNASKLKYGLQVIGNRIGPVFAHIDNPITFQESDDTLRLKFKQHMGIAKQRPDNHRADHVGEPTANPVVQMEPYR